MRCFEFAPTFSRRDLLRTSAAGFGQLALAAFGEPHLIQGSLLATRTVNGVFEPRTSGLGRHRDLTHLAIKNHSALTALGVDEHRVASLRDCKRARRIPVL